MADQETLAALNSDFIDHVQNGDVAGADKILAEEFYASYPDGSLVDRAGFLAETAKPVTIKGLKADQVIIRIFGDFAVIHGRINYTSPEGRRKDAIPTFG